MNRNFARALSLVLKHEGGFANNPKDPGGPTNKGITLATFRRYVDRKATVDDLKHLTTDQAGKVYRKRYWDKVRGDDLPAGIDYAVFDFAVNSGLSRAAKYLQKVLGVVQDGAIGPVTLAAARKADAGTVIERLCADRMAFLRRLPTWGTFGRGWTARVSNVEGDALAMAASPQEPPQEAQEPVPAPVQPEAPKRASAAKQGGIALAVVGVIAALAHWWHDLTTWIGSFF